MPLRRRQERIHRVAKHVGEARVLLQRDQGQAGTLPTEGQAGLVRLVERQRQGDWEDAARARRGPSCALRRVSVAFDRTAAWDEQSHRPLLQIGVLLARSMCTVL